VVGSRTGKYYTLGDEVKVKVMRCDLMKKQIDFKMISDLTVKRESLPQSARPKREANRKPERGKKKHFEPKHKKRGRR
jgi:transcriptional accessory protein Tex/SPT6